MTLQLAVDDFLKQKTLAVVGASRKPLKFGNMVYKELKKRGYRVFPVNPQTATLGDVPCYPNLKSLPEPVDGVVVVVPPTQTELVVREAAEAGIRRIWLQQGAESENAIHFCRDNGMSVVYGECILMFTEPIGFWHKPHRWLWKLLGKLPK